MLGRICRGEFETRPYEGKTLLLGKKFQDRGLVLPRPRISGCPEYQWVSWRAKERPELVRDLLSEPSENLARGDHWPSIQGWINEPRMVRAQWSLIPRAFL